MSRIAQLTCVLAISAAALSAQVATPPPFVETTAMIGLGNSQTAQLNLLNPGVLAPALGAICTAGVAFVGADGNVIKSGVLRVLPGQAQSFSLHTDSDISVAVGDRRDIRAVITIPALTPTANGTAASAAPCHVIPNLEIYDNMSGRTLVTLGHVEQVK